MDDSPIVRRKPATVIAAGLLLVAALALDYIGYYSGNNSSSANRPQLVVTYQ